MNHTKKLIVIAGGTGGHIFPGLAVAQHLINQGWKVRWIGTDNRMEIDLVPKHGIDIDCIHIFGLRGSKLKELILAPVFILNAFFQAYTFIKKFNPNIVLGMGGYVSGPGVLAAWFLRIPVVLHEQNYVAGLTNKLLVKIARKVLQAFPGTFPHAKVVGNPIRTSILKIPHPKVRFQKRKGPIRILIIGGSQGSQLLNQIMPKAAKKLGDRIIIWHQSGKNFKKTVETAYFNAIKNPFKISEFIDDMEIAYNWADFIICRSGALTVSEISVIGLPAIFVPFNHKDRQQYWNAFSLEKVGAAKILEQSKFTVDAVVKIISSLDRKKLLEMANIARTLAVHNSTELVAKELLLLAV